MDMGGGCVAFPIVDGGLDDPYLFCYLLLEQSEVEPALPDMVP